jgi:anhydro-N-acetylmuramic acid kinase
MSGTSLDGVDGAMVAFTLNADGTLALTTLASVSCDMPVALRTRLQSLASAQYASKSTEFVGSLDPIEEAALAANALTDLYLEVIERLREQVPNVHVAAVGAHGQTIRHRPQQAFTLQLINGARLAALSHLPTICDFRSADIALGGHGAPLVPLFHQQTLSSTNETRVILNLGGIANLSILNSKGVTGFDTGPASTLLDAWAQKHLGERYDKDGAWAASGRYDEALLHQILSEESFFSQQPPKSTGRELFSLGWLEESLFKQASTKTIRANDVQATLSRLTARSIAQATYRAIEENQQPALGFYACGGGVRNLQLMKDISQELRLCFGRNIPLKSSEALGIDPQQMEACAFAWLAWQRWNNRALNYSAVTGSSRPHIAGALYLP